MIKRFDLPNDINNLAEIEDFTSKKVHIVCPALKKNSLCSYLLTVKCKMDIAEAGKLCDTVNIKKETGCLFPRYQLTIFPVYESIKNKDIKEECRKIVKDIMEANSHYYKNEKMIFVLDDYQWDSAELFLEYFEQNINLPVNHILKELDCYIPK